VAIVAVIDFALLVAAAALGRGAAVVIAGPLGALIGHRYLLRRPRPDGIGAA